MRSARFVPAGERLATEDRRHDPNFPSLASRRTLHPSRACEKESPARECECPCDRGDG